MAAYERRLEEELAELTCEELPDREPPEHPSPTKEKALRSRGQQPLRTALYRAAAVDLTRIDGISVRASRTIVTEIGLDLSAFPTEAHFVAWLGLAPRTAISGGKTLGRKKRGKALGASRVAGVLRMSAASLKHSPTALGAALRRRARHKGMAEAIFRIARMLARLVYRMLRYGQDYVDFGAKAYEERFRQQALTSLQARARSLGCTVVPRAPSEQPTPLAQPA